MIVLTPVDRCHFCERREAEMNVDLEGRIVGCCGECWERADWTPNGFGREIPRGDDDDA